MLLRWGRVCPPHLQMVPESRSECVEASVLFSKKSTGQNGKTPHSLSNHTDPFRDTCSAALCLRATAESGEGGIVSLELLAMALPCQSCCESCCCWQLCRWQLFPPLTVCPRSQPILQPLQKNLQNQELCGLPLLPCSSVSRIPGLLIALCRAIGSSAFVSDIRHFLWLNSSNSDTDLTFSWYFLRLESQKEQKNPRMQGLALGANFKLN